LEELASGGLIERSIPFLREVKDMTPGAEMERWLSEKYGEARAARHPALAVERDAAARHDQMDVRMMSERRTPGMENRSDADAGAEVLWIGGDRGRVSAEALNSRS
jgi:hypothetical protein